MLQHKLKSNTGASLAIALLLFLICAVLGALVLTAGSASAGRFSKLQERDQTYYKVASAAQLLMTELDGAEVQITRDRRTTTLTSVEYVKDEDGFEVPQSPTVDTTVEYHTALNGAHLPELSVGGGTDYVSGSTGSALPDDMSFLTDLAARMLFAEQSGGSWTLPPCNTADAWGRTVQGNTYEAKGSFTLEPSSAGLDPALTGAMAIRCDYELKPGGMLYLTLADSSEFSMTLTLAAELRDGPTQSTHSGTTTTSVNGDGNNVATTTDIVNETRTSSVKWTVRSVA